MMGQKARWLDNKHVIFGKVTKGYDFVEIIADLPNDRESGEPLRFAYVKDCSVRVLDDKYNLSEQELHSTDDILL